MDTFDTLRSMIAAKFEKNAAEITPDATFETLGIDSLDTFDLIFEAEDKFGIKVPNDSVAVTTVQDVVELIDRLRLAQGA